MKKIVVCMCLLSRLAGCGGIAKVTYPVWESDSITGLPSQPISAGSQPVVDSAENVLPITVGPTNKFLVSVTICTPGGDVCQTVDKIMVDTGAIGLRIHASALPLLQGKLPALEQSGQIIAQCATFGNFYTWGSYRTADVTLGARKANAIPMQVYDDPELPEVGTTDCGAKIGGLLHPLPSAVQWNGILGIRGARRDSTGSYHICEHGATSCTPTTLSEQQLLPNPLVYLPQDNNGFQIVMPGIPDSGMNLVSGALILGLNTQKNNQLPQNSSSDSQLLMLDSKQRFSLITDGIFYGALMDSGNSVNALATFDAPTCGVNAALGFCPNNLLTQPIQLAAVKKPTVTFTASLMIGNFLNLLAMNLPAINNITTKIPRTMEASGIQAMLGAPFFYGRRISFSIDGQPVQLPNSVVDGALIAFN